MSLAIRMGFSFLMYVILGTLVFTTKRMIHIVFTIGLRLFSVFQIFVLQHVPKSPYFVFIRESDQHVSMSEAIRGILTDSSK